MCFKKLKIRFTIVRLIFVPILSFICILALSNGIMELLQPEWEIFIDYPALITVLAWLEFIGICFLTIVSIYCLVVLYYVLTKHVSTKELEDALNELKKRD